MKFIFTSILSLIFSLSAYGVELSVNDLNTLEASVKEQSPKLRNSLLRIGRVSLADIRVGVLLDDSGHILAPYLAPIDELDLPYIMHDAEGVPTILETKWQDKKLGLAILKAEKLTLENRSPIRLAGENSLEKCSWLLTADFPPEVLAGDKLQISLASIITTAKEPKEDEVTKQEFLVDVYHRRAGSFIFDLSGKLVAVTTKRKKGGVTFLAATMKHLIAQSSELKKYLPTVEESALPDLPYFANAKQDSSQLQGQAGLSPVASEVALDKIANKVMAQSSVVSIQNEATQASSSIHGVIISSNGLILTKASEVGPIPQVNYEDKLYPAVLLASDDRTDLAILSIEAKDLPTIKWSKESPTEGCLLHSPKVNTAPPHHFTSTTGIISHRMPKHAATSIHSQSLDNGTSLGIVAEHGLPNITVAAILPDSPAAKSGLKRNDVLISINDISIKSRAALRNTLVGFNVGDEVTVKLQRDNSELEIQLTLARAKLRPPISEPVMSENGANTMIHLPSIRKSGFPETFVHDLAVENWQNGSPIYDNNGNAIGINIASVTLGRTLALPVSSIKLAIQRMLTSKVSF